MSVCLSFCLSVCLSVCMYVCMYVCIFLQQFLAIESFHNFAFLGTDGDGTAPPTCSKLLAQYVRSRAVMIHLFRVSCTEKRNVEKSSITVSVSDGFFNSGASALARQRSSIAKEIW